MSDHCRAAAFLVIILGLVSCSLVQEQPTGEADLVKWVKGTTAVPVVAVLPFTNETDHDDLSHVVRSAFYSHFSVLPFKDLEISTIDKTLKNYEKDHNKLSATLSFQELGGLLGCQALVYGTVTKFSRVYAGLYSQIGVGARIRIVEPTEGKTLWEDTFTTRFHEGGVPLTHVTAAISLVKSGLNLRTSQEVRAVDDLCRNLVSRIPPIMFSPGLDGLEVLCELQIAAFRDSARALSLKRELENKKYTAVIIRTVLEDGVAWHRVVMGPFSCGEEIDWWKAKVAREFTIKPVVLRSERTTYSATVERRKE